MVQPFAGTKEWERNRLAVEKGEVCSLHVRVEVAFDPQVDGVESADECTSLELEGRVRDGDGTRAPSAHGRRYSNRSDP